MVETNESARRWNGFVCPDCRFVFRVPRDHDGRGVVCPGCRRMLKIPATGEATPPLLAKSRSLGKIEAVSLPESFQKMKDRAKEGTAEAGVSADPAVQKGEIKRRRRENTREEEHSWEKVDNQRVRVGGKSRSNVLKWFLAGTLALVLLGTLLVLMRPAKRTIYEPISYAPEAPKREETQDVPDDIELPAEMEKNEVELAAELEIISREFLGAKSVEEMLPLVRDPARVEPKMRAFYRGRKIDPPGLGQFNIYGMIGYKERLASVSVRTSDFAVKHLAFLRGDDDTMRVDWESYVAWSGMDWDAFMSERPEKPVLFRVQLKQSDYYNFRFSEDTEWRCLELRSADGEYLVYGYLKRGSELERKIVPADAKTTSMVTVRLRYPEGEKKANQVLVDSMVSDGWVTDGGEQ